MASSPWRVVCLALAIAGGSCKQVGEPAKSQTTSPIPAACHIVAPEACRVGCDVDEPRKVFDVEPDFSGIDLVNLHGFAIAEILIDVRGEVRDICLLRRVRDDVDVRAVEAIRHWRFAPARLRHSSPPGLPVPVVLTVSLAVGR